MRPRALLATAALLLASRGALAQSAGPSLDLRGFRAPTGPDSGFFLEPADAPGTLDWNAGLWMSYAYRPITLRSTKTGAVTANVIAHQLTSDLVGSVGLGHRLAVGFDLPVLIEQTGDKLSERSRRLLGDTPLPGQALGDLGITAKLTVMRPTAGDLGGIAVALSERFTLPTGDEASYLGEGAVTSETRLLLEYRLAAVGVHATAGVFLRAQQERFACGGLAQDAPCPTQFGHALPFGVGFSLKPQIFGVDHDGHTTLYLELHGHTPLAPSQPFQSTAVSSLQASLGARYALRDVSLFGGVETALSSGVGDAQLRVALAVCFAPRGHDVDGDGIEDDLDQCLELPEDKDGYKDDDGCPDADNDEDGVPDKADKCPLAKEDEDSHEDDDGCPDPDNDGDGIVDADDACPLEPGVRSDDPKKNGCPRPDRDKDGIADADDACPLVPGAASADPKKNGCPPDRDEDGVPDGEDACPDVKGFASPDPKKNGCPRDTDGDSFRDDTDACPRERGHADPDPTKHGCPKAVRVTEKNVVILQQVQFDTDRATIKPVSDPLLDEVAQVLKEHPEILLIEIQGHTDDRGTDEHNRVLSQNRANSVMAALVRRGIDSTRLTAQGYGRDQPIDDNKTEAGRQRNRRVQFKIIKKAAYKPQAPTGENR